MGGLRNASCRTVVSLSRRAKEGKQVKRLAVWATLLPFCNL
jgi:hypothetical protein